MATDYVGIDYSLGMANRDKSNGIHYGVISQNEVLQAWADSSEAYYGEPEEAACPECKHIVRVKGKEWGDPMKCEFCDSDFDLELPDFADPVSHFIDDEEISAECGESGDIFITKSLYYTRAQFCSPCAPGAGYLMNPCPDGPKTYCFGHDWFEDQQAPYPVFRVSDDSIVLPDAEYYGKEMLGKVLSWGVNSEGRPFVVTHPIPTRENNPVTHFN
jgi:hypothetical protein